MVFCNVKLDGLDLKQAKDRVGDFLSSTKQYKIFTPNPEFIVQAQKDDDFKNILNAGDLNICDGFGLSLFSGCPRITGVDFMIEICKISAEKNINVYLLGSGNDEVVKKTAENLQIQIPGLEITGYNKGIQINSILSYDKEENERTIQSINESKAGILFVAFGMNKQERWISENLSKMPNIKIAMGVGGSFDYLSGTVRRAPCFLRKIGLEWLYRLIKQPSRIQRIWNAITIFPYIVIKNKFIK
ncbi:MAG TPA: WecB/TagA/CpsF family glycosyltransferase [Candidatus Magasanikbacteria bacterium]|nr:WecB/TagA/CpsF family glycosyltransferase [Candidatus Magasanikbacteria bacterium]